MDDRLYQSGGGDAQGLARVLGPLEATTIVLGGIIGSGIFIAPGIVAREVEAPGLSFGVWAGAGLVAMCGALCYAELSAAIPETGGTYAFLRRAYKFDIIAFLFGWTMFFGICTGAIAAGGAAFALYANYVLGDLAPREAWAARWEAAACILFLTTMNCIGARVGGRIQNYVTAVKVLSLAGLVVCGLLYGHGSIHKLQPVLPLAPPRGGILAAFGTAMIPALFAYQGWNFSASVAGEIKNPRLNVPLSISVGLGVVIVAYLAVNFVYIYILPFDQLQHSKTVAADTLEAILGSGGGHFISIAVMFSAFGGANSQLLSNSRIQYAMSRDKLFFGWMDRIHPRYRTPSMAIFSQGLLAAAFALSGTYLQILTYVSFVEYLFLTLAVAGVIVLRHKEPTLSRPYKVWGYPFTPLIFIAICVWFLLNALAFRFTESMVGVVLMLCGLPFYLYWTRKESMKRFAAKLRDA